MAASIGAAVVLITVLIAIGWGMLLERAATIRSVASNLEAASAALRSSSWAEARAATDRARMQMATGGPESLRRRLDRSLQDLAMVEKLDAIRLQAAESGQIDFDKSKTDREYMEAFSSTGLCTSGELPERVASRIATSDICGPLVTAFDHWAGRVLDNKRRQWVLEIARRADPAAESAWRSRVRHPAVWRDRDALRGLASEFAVESESVALLLNLASLLEEAGAESLAFLRRVQAAHPDDFWANFTLAEKLDQRGDQNAVGFYRAALAIRPRSVAAYVNLAVALNKQGQVPESLEYYRRALQIRPDSAPVQFFLANGLYTAAQYDEVRVHCRERFGSTRNMWAPSA